MSNFQPVEQRESHVQRARGGGGVNIGGTHVPYWALGAGALVLGVLGYFVWRQFRGSGSQAGTTAQQATGTAGLTPMAAAGTTGGYDVMPTPYPNAATTVGVTPTQTSGLGLTPGATVDPTGASASPAGVGTGPIVTPSQAAGGYGPISNQIYWVSGGEPMPVPSQNNPTADSLTNTATTASTSG